MSKGGSSGGTTTQVNTPPPQVMQNYENVTQQAQQVASQPLQQYAGPMIAGFTPQQVEAFNTIEGAQNVASPYINAAAGLAGSAATPITPTSFSPGAVNQYLSPYTQDVVNATQAQFANQNAQQQQQVIGNAISSGAWGGDRASVAQGITAGQQALAQAPVIANLYNQGYGQALGEFNTQQQVGVGAQEASGWLGANAAYALGNLGQEAQSTQLTGANAELSAGTLQQQLAQEQLNIPYENFLQAQGYPFQTTNWLAGIDTGIGNSSGGYAYTTTPGPSELSQVLGGIGTAASIAGLIMANRGGRITPQRRGYDSGGIVLPSLPTVPDVSTTYSYLTPFQSAGGRGPPTPGNAAQQPQQSGGGMDTSNIGSLVKALKSLQGSSSSGNDYTDYVSSLDSSGLQAIANGNIGPALEGTGGGFAGAYGLIGGGVKRGGRIGMADGGTPPAAMTPSTGVVGYSPAPGRPDVQIPILATGAPRTAIDPSTGMVNMNPTSNWSPPDTNTLPRFTINPSAAMTPTPQAAPATSLSNLPLNGQSPNAFASSLSPAATGQIVNSPGYGGEQMTPEQAAVYQWMALQQMHQSGDSGGARGGNVDAIGGPRSSGGIVLPAEAMTGYDNGGAIQGSGAISAGQPIAGGNPTYASAYQNLSQLPVEKLQELSMRMPPTSPQGQVLQKVLQAKKMNPTAGMQTAPMANAPTAISGPIAPTTSSAMVPQAPQAPQPGMAMQPGASMQPAMGAYPGMMAAGGMVSSGIPETLSDYNRMDTRFLRKLRADNADRPMEAIGAGAGDAATDRSMALPIDVPTDSGRSLTRRTHYDDGGAIDESSLPASAQEALAGARMSRAAGKTDNVVRDVYAPALMRDAGTAHIGADSHGRVDPAIAKFFNSWATEMEGRAGGGRLGYDDGGMVAGPILTEQPLAGDSAPYRPYQKGEEPAFDWGRLGDRVMNGINAVGEAANPVNMQWRPGPAGDPALAGQSSGDMPAMPNTPLSTPRQAPAPEAIVPEPHAPPERFNNRTADAPSRASPAILPEGSPIVTVSSSDGSGTGQPGSGGAAPWDLPAGARPAPKRAPGAAMTPMSHSGPGGENAVVAAPPSAITLTGNTPSELNPTGGVGVAPSGGTPGYAQPGQGGSAPPADQPPARAPLTEGRNTKLAANPWMALLAASLGTLASRSPYPGVAIGEGGQQALKYLQTEEAAEQRAQDKADEQEYRKQEIDARKRGYDLEAEKLHQLAQQSRDRLTLDQSKLEEEKRQHNLEAGWHGAEQQWHQDMLNQGRYTWAAGMGPDPNDPTKMVPGTYRNPTRGDEEPRFYPGQVQTGTRGGGAGVTTDLANKLIQDGTAKDMKEALEIIHDPSGAHQAQVRQAQEKLAEDAATKDPGYMANPAATLTKFREFYGLPAISAGSATAPAAGGEKKSAPAAEPLLPGKTVKQYQGKSWLYKGGDPKDKASWVEQKP